MQNELKLVKELTDANEEQIKLHDDGYWSRAYVVNQGEFVVKFQKREGMDYKNEAKILNHLNTLELPISVQKVIHLPENNSYFFLRGVIGTPISEIKNLSLEQKQKIAKPLGAFVRQIESVEIDLPDAHKRNLDGELADYRKNHDDCKDFYERHFTKEEQAALNYLMYTHLPQARKALGERIVFCHADIWEPNILIDDKGNVGSIDCANAGYYDEAADFGLEDNTLRSLVLDSYGASETLRKKVELKFDMTIIGVPKYGIPLWGEDFIVSHWVPRIREVIDKYKSEVAK